MAPASHFRGKGLTSFTEYGIDYQCPDCEAKASIRAPGALLAGAIYSILWAVVGVWAFYQGPLWYIRHFPYFLEDTTIVFFLLDVLAMAFYCGLIALALWISWNELFTPLKTLIQHPVTHENRARSDEETSKNSINLRMALMSLLAFPLLVWALLLGAFWLMDAMGFELRDNAIIKFSAMAFIFGASAAIGKYFNTNGALVFFGMVIWLAIFITVLFTFG